MATRCGLIALLLAIFPLSQQHNDNSSKQVGKDECSTWMYHNSSKEADDCICGTDHYNEIICSSTPMEISIIDGLAMTYDSESQTVVAWHTIFGWIHKPLTSRDKIYRKVPLNKSLLNHAICGRLNRDGQLCGACKEGYSPQVLSFDFHCKQCSRTKNEWLKFLLVSFVPTTLFYVFVLLFKFNANSSSIHAYILLAQLVYSPLFIRFYSVQYNNGSLAVNALITFYGMWNFDLLRALHLNICLQLTTLQALALDYVIPCYVLLLVLMTYTATELHSRGCKIMIYVFNPFQKCFYQFKKQWHMKSSMVDVFSTFLLLSYNRLVSAHMNFLVYVKPFNITGVTIGKYLYYDPTVPYFGKEHQPYVVLALLMCLFFSFLPLLLLLFYPMRWFQKCLDCFKLNFYGLQIFVDSFTGCYKDGTEPGTRDCRCFAALFLLLRILTYLTISVIPTICAIAINGIIIMLFMATFIACQPYKTKFAAYNRITGIMLAITSAIYMASFGSILSHIKVTRYLRLNLNILTWLIIMPQLYIPALTLKWLIDIIRTAKPRCMTQTPLLKNNYSLKHYAGL